MTGPRVWQIVLAAGGSKRMGESKALISVGERPALEVVVRAALAGGCCGALAVVRTQDRDPASAVLRGLPLASVVLNPDPDAGRSGSLQIALAALPATADAALVHPVDHPLVSSGTIRALLERAAEERDRESAGRPLLFEPFADARPGHPLLFDRGAFTELAALDPAAPLRDLVRDLRAAGLARRVAVDDRGILANIDSADDRRRWGLE